MAFSTCEEELSAGMHLAADWWRTEVKVVQHLALKPSLRCRAVRFYCRHRDELKQHAHEMIMDITADKLTDLLIFSFVGFLGGK